MEASIPWLPWAVTECEIPIYFADVNINNKTTWIILIYIN